jgi:hypothetical protein
MSPPSGTAKNALAITARHRKCRAVTHEIEHLTFSNALAGGLALIFTV